MFRKFFKKMFGLFLLLGLIGATIGVFGAMFLYHKVTEDLPRIDQINDYQPEAVTSILAKDGTLIAEVFSERRYPVPFKVIPIRLRNAFLAAEDAGFYNHPGIDIRGIIRAIVVNLKTKEHTQGASTITQQLVKSLLLSREKTYTRKLKEAILSYRLEKALSKNEIFGIYLNQIYLGATAYGVKAAAQVYFHKEMKDLTIAEAAFIASMPKKPSYLGNPAHFKEALNRQRYVINQMYRHQMISKEEQEKAKEEKIAVFPPSPSRFFHSPYYTQQAIRDLEVILKKISPEEGITNPGGYNVRTALDLKAGEIADRSVKRALEELDKRQGWRGPSEVPAGTSVLNMLDSQALEIGDQLKVGKIYKALVTELNVNTGVADVQVGDFQGVVNLKEAGWAKRFVSKTDIKKTSYVLPERLIKSGEIIEVSLDVEKNSEKDLKDPLKKIQFKLDQSPLAEGAFVVQNVLTGEVIALVGGYDYGRSVFNRVTQALRQAGSSFKPFIYLAALENLGYTPSTIVPDTRISLIAGNGKLWSPENFDHKYLGPITLRTALQRSRNVVSAYLIDKLGIDPTIKVARRLGISTFIPRQISIALGAGEIKLIEMIRAYGAFANGGFLSDQIFVSEIKDRNGNVIYKKRPQQKRVIDEEHAFLMANMMKGVVERGTAQLIKQLNRPTAGKTGTTNEQMDAWFLGYTPEFVGGCWAGFDQKRMLGRMETGGKAAAPMFLYFMQEYLKDAPVTDFEIPDGMVPAQVDLESGRLLGEKTTSGFTEYFISGTEPRSRVEDLEIPRDYLLNQDF
jgi:penicillin-binding protein 1A